MILLKFSGIINIEIKINRFRMENLAAVTKFQGPVDIDGKNGTQNWEAYLYNEWVNSSEDSFDKYLFDNYDNSANIFRGNYEFDSLYFNQKDAQDEGYQGEWESVYTSRSNSSSPTSDSTSSSRPVRDASLSEIRNHSREGAALAEAFDDVIANPTDSVALDRFFAAYDVFRLSLNPDEENFLFGALNLLERVRQFFDTTQNAEESLQDFRRRVSDLEHDKIIDQFELNGEQQNQYFERFGAIADILGEAATGAADAGVSASAASGKLAKSVGEVSVP